MNKKQLGEYLAPEIKVMEIHSRAVLCGSPATFDGFGDVDNPFSGNGDELNW